MPQRRNDREPALEALPEAYARWRRSTLGRITDALEERLLLERIGPAPGLRVLDVGCGDGRLATTLAAAGAQVTGLDASPVMLAAARRRAEAEGAALALVAGHAGRLPFADRRFDRVISVATLCFSEDPQLPIREMTRVLEPGGRLILGELGGWNAWAVVRRLKGWLGSAVWRAARFRSRADLLALADDAGLTDASVTGAVFYPPLGPAARVLAAADHMIGSRTTIGAALLVLTATKPETAGEPPRLAGRTASNGARLETREKDRGMRDQSKSDWLAPATAALSLVACYGTLAAIGLLGALGVTIALNEAVWAGAIVLLAGATCVALVIRRREHGRTAPLVVAGLGFVLIGFSMLVAYERLVELLGFAFLGSGTFLDWRIGRGR